MKESRLLTIIIVSFNTKNILRECLNSVKKYTVGIESETFVVDNDSSDGSVEMVSKEFPEVKLIVNTENVGFAAGNNIALKKASGRHVLLLNSDVFLLPETIEKTVKFMDENRNCGILGVKLLSEDGSIQPSARKLPSPWNKFLVISGLASKFPKSRFFGSPDYSWWSHNEVREVGWVPGAYFLIRAELLKEIGLLDERYFMYFEEIDYCLQAIRAGWKVIFYPDGEVIHLRGQSSAATKKQITKTGKQLIGFRVKSEFRYYRKNFGVLSLFLSAGVEVFWKGLTLLKNITKNDDYSKIKKEEAILILNTIIKTLLNDRLGRGAI